MSVSSISSDLTIGPKTSPVDKTKKTSTTPSALKHVIYRGKTYAVSIWKQDTRGHQAQLALNDQDSLEKVNALVKELIQAHEKKSHTAAGLSDPIKIKAQGLYFKNTAAPISHDFTIQDQDPALAQQLAAQLSTTAKPVLAASVKAQDAWDALEHIVQTRSTRVKSPTPPISKDKNTSPKTAPTTASAKIHSAKTDCAKTHSTKPADRETGSPRRTATEPSDTETDSPNETPIASPAPVRSGPVTSAELDLREEGVDTTKSHWFDRIQSPYLKRRILTNIIKGDRPQGSPAEKYYQKLCDASEHPLTKAAELLQPIKKHIRQLEASSLSQIPQKVRQKAEDISDFYSLPTDTPSYASRLQGKIEELLKEDFDRSELYRYFSKQAIAEGENATLINKQWCETHFTDNADRFVQALNRWMDNA